MSSPIGFGLPPSAGQPALVFEPSVGQVPTNDPAGQALALTAAQVQAVQALQPAAVGEGINGVGRTITYYGGAIPDPRQRAQIIFAAIDGGAIGDFLQPQADRRIVLGMASGASNSSVTEAAGERTVVVMPDAAAAGLRWVDQHPSRGQFITTAAAVSAAVLDIQQGV